MSLKELTKGLLREDLITGEVRDPKELGNLMSLCSGHHTMFTYHANDAEVTANFYKKMLISNTGVFYRAGYTDAINNNTIEYKLSTDNEKFYIDGFLCGLADRENNTVDNENLLEDFEQQILEELKGEL